MPNATWPGTLPASFQADGYEEGGKENMLRSNMDAGPAKMRRRFTAAVRPVQGIIVVDETQLATFKTFYGTTLKDGSLPFDWHEHLPAGDATVATFRFVAPYRARAIEGQQAYEISMQLEITP